MCKKIFAFFVLALIGISHAGIITSPISPKMNFISPKTHPKLYKEVETPQPPPTIFARKVQWGIDNMVTADGWSLTGYSSTDKDSEGRYARWKFGFIGGDCAASEMLVAPTISLDEDLNVKVSKLYPDVVMEQIRRDVYTDQISLHLPRPGFGFFISKEW